MWKFLVKYILRYRTLHLSIIALGTAFMAYEATRVKLSYELVQMLPSSDPDSKVYEDFKENFGQDGMTMFAVIKNDKIYNLETFNQWYDLTYRLNSLEGVYEVVSIARTFELYKDTLRRKFDFKPLFAEKPKTQEELDSLLGHLKTLPFYDGLLFSKESGTTLIAVTMDKEQMFTKERNRLITAVEDEVHAFSEHTGLEVHFTGLPFIRKEMQHTIQSELLMFVLLALVIAGIALFIFFRSFKATIFPLLIVVIALIWVVGIIEVLGYEITILTGILPPLMIIIGVENCIFLLNKYHHEFRGHGNKIRALSRVIQRVGNAIFLTNLTTAVGFATFIVTGNDILVEFGLVAAISIMILFVLTLFLIPIFYSYLPEPKTRHTKHLDNKYTAQVINWIVNVITNHRKKVYVVTLVSIAIAAVGLSQLKVTGNYIDDVPKSGKMYQDLLFMEEEFQGMLPFEISIDTRKPRGVMNLNTIRKIDQLQDTLMTYPEFSRPMSVAEVVKYAHQAFYSSGDLENYTLPSNRTMGFMLSYLPQLNNDSNQAFRSFVDPEMQRTRISARMKNIGTKEIKQIKESLIPKIDAIFNPGLTLKRNALMMLDTLNDLKWKEKRKTVKQIEGIFDLAQDGSRDADSLLESRRGYLPPQVHEYLSENSWNIGRTRDYDISLTGVSVMYLKGSAYLVKNLRASLILAILAIGAIMALLFSSFRMVTVSMIPNLLPQLMTAAMMGFLAVPIKPSTVLIFSIALGISVDNAIHFLSRYRFQLMHSNWNIRLSVIHALKETGFGILYSSVVLLLGFGIFITSKFGGTQAVGYLVSFTLLVAVTSNLILLPSILLELDRTLTAKAFKEPMLVILEEEDDIEVDHLEIEDSYASVEEPDESSPNSQS